MAAACSNPIRKLLDAHPSLKQRPVILHMDINKTIIHVDVAGGKTMEDVLNANVGKMVFGHVTSSDAGAAMFTAVSCSQDAVSVCPAIPPNARFMCFDDFVDVALPTMAGFDSLPPAERREQWKQLSGKRRAMKASFTHPGNPGEAYAQFVEQQRKALTRPNGTSMWNIVPSFFNVMNELSAAEWPFVLVFRTFGSDLPEILEEWKEFIGGHHDFGPPQGPLLAHLVHKEVPVGVVYRDKQGLSFCWGTAQSPPPPHDDTAAPLHGEDYLRTLPQYASARNVSYSDLYKELVDAAHGPVIGAVDFYPFWSQNGENRMAGKVFPVLKTSSPDQPAPFQIFFDDNICHGDVRSIVDMRDALSGEPIPADGPQEGLFCCAVDSFQAICNVEYFAEQLAEHVYLQAHVT